MKRGAAIALALSGVLFAAMGSIFYDGQTRMSDALPLYLYGAAFLEGLSPVDPSSLQEVYDSRGLRVGAAIWSTLYPATAAPLMAPLGALSWDGFTRLWGALLLAASLGVGAIVPGGRDRWVAAGVGVALMGFFLPTAEAARLGQVNALLALLGAAALLAIHRDRDLLAGALVGVGACLKLVPVVLVFPWLLAKRWKTAVGGLLIGVPVLLLSFLATSPAELAAALRTTAQFQDAVAPGWLDAMRFPAWLVELGTLRHRGLLAASLGASAGLCLWRPSREVQVGCGALLLAWLGADAAAFHVLYAPLYAPAMVWLALWALDDGPRWRWGISAVAVVGGLVLPRVEFMVEDATVSCVIFGYLLWAGVLARSCWHALGARETGPLEGLVRRHPVLLAGAAGLALSLLLLLPRADIDAALPEGATLQADGSIVFTGPGFLDATTAPPGSHLLAPGDRGGDLPTSLDLSPTGGQERWPEMSPIGHLRKGTRKELDQHLQSAPARWEALAEELPAEDAAAARAQGAAIPIEDLAELQIEELVGVLAAEGILLSELGWPEPLSSEWQAALAPGR